MKSAKLTAIIYAVILSVLLLLPTLTIRYVDHEARGVWENRKLTEFPDKSRLMSEPKAVFSQFDDYLNDHIGGSFQAIKFRRKFYFDVFNSTGDTYIVGKNDGALFLTAPFRQKDRTSHFQWWNNLCFKLQRGGFQKNYLKRVNASKENIGRYGAQVIYTSIPSTPVLIPDEFPMSAPKRLKDSCAKVTPQNNHIVKMSAMAPDVEFFYPLGVFQEKAKDPYFYPNSAYHWQGESTWVFIEEFAKEFDFALPKSWPAGPCEYRNVKWDIGKLVGVGTEVMGCDRDLSELEIQVNERFDYPLNDEYVAANPRKKTIRVVKMENPHAPNDKTAIIFTNSFGPAVRQQYASLFKTTYHVRPGIINTRDIRILLKESDILDVDVITIAIADFHYPNFLGPLE